MSSSRYLISINFPVVDIQVSFFMVQKYLPSSAKVLISQNPQYILFVFLEPRMHYFYASISPSVVTHKGLRRRRNFSGIDAQISKICSQIVFFLQSWPAFYWVTQNIEFQKKVRIFRPNSSSNNFHAPSSGPELAESPFVHHFSEKPHT